MTTLLSLPNEVLIDIILLFDAVRDIKALQKVCTFLNRLVEQSQTLLYHLHKLIAGVVDLPSTASSQDRLDALRAREEAWDRLRFRHHETLLVTFQSAFLYDMADGEMVLIRDDQEGQAAGLVSFTLPSISQGLSRSVAEGTTMDTNLKLFDVSLSAKEDDLLVLFYTRVCVISPSTSPFSWDLSPPILRLKRVGFYGHLHTFS
ncbi:hypothetical protein OF83DRAFT_1171995 [Amylostereum chailletii]|nr:hypothetical protein OF83DRAFT_1171995 [Amylostereum chailletii]